MRIDRIHIRGFKSLHDLRLSGLSDVNVFQGPNGSGKSNIFQALDLWSWLHKQEETPEGQLSLLPTSRLIPWERLEGRFGPPIFSMGKGTTISLLVQLSLEAQDFQDSTFVPQVAVREIEAVLRSNSLPADHIRVASECQLALHPNGVLSSCTTHVLSNSAKFDLSDHSASRLLTCFHLVPAMRHFSRETVSDEEGDCPAEIQAANLKRCLLATESGRNPQLKKNVEYLKRVLNTAPFDLGTLDVMLEPATNRIDIGFVQPDGWLPLENMGTGSQQLLLILGQLLLNGSPVVAIEEPEMNLAPNIQQALHATLRRLQRDPNCNLSQVLLSTHSSHFKDGATVFDLAVDELGATQIGRHKDDSQAAMVAPGGSRGAAPTAGRGI